MTTQRRAILFLKNIPEIFSLGVTFGDEKIEGEETPTVPMSKTSRILDEVGTGVGVFCFFKNTYGETLKAPHS